MLTENDFILAAKTIGCSLSTIKAVHKVESNGSGMLSTGEPKILFEPHIFWRELKKRGIDPNLHVKGNEDILYPIWGSKPYGKISDQHKRLQRAVAINRDAALSSASWGLFQILGNNFKAAGFQNLQQFISAMYKGEGAQLQTFVKYIINVGLDDELRLKAWKQFAAGYNGAYYFKNKYDTKLGAAELLFR